MQKLDIVKSLEIRSYKIILTVSDIYYFVYILI